jgi:hypothetical protein
MSSSLSSNGLFLVKAIVRNCALNASLDNP